MSSNNLQHSTGTKPPSVGPTPRPGDCFGRDSPGRANLDGWFEAGKPKEPIHRKPRKWSGCTRINCNRIQKQIRSDYYNRVNIFSQGADKTLLIALLDRNL